MKITIEHEGDVYVYNNYTRRPEKDAYDAVETLELLIEKIEEDRADKARQEEIIKSEDWKEFVNDLQMAEIPQFSGTLAELKTL